MKIHTHIHTHTHIYIYIYTLFTIDYRFKTEVLFKSKKNIFYIHLKNIFPGIILEY